MPVRCAFSHQLIEGGTDVTSSTVTAVEFSRVWNDSSSAKEAASRLGLSAAAASERACRYRRKGINLKRFKSTGRPRIDAAAVNRALEGA